MSPTVEKLSSAYRFVRSYFTDGGDMLPIYIDCNKKVPISLRIVEIGTFFAFVTDDPQPPR